MKGHATNEQVEAGEVKAEDNVGNDHSDGAATRGIESCMPGLAQLARIYDERHEKYMGVMLRVQRFVAAMKKEEQEARRQMKKRSDPLIRRKMKK